MINIVWFFLKSVDANSHSSYFFPRIMSVTIPISFRMCFLLIDLQAGAVRRTQLESLQPATTEADYFFWKPDIWVVVMLPYSRSLIPAALPPGCSSIPCAWKVRSHAFYTSSNSARDTGELCFHFIIFNFIKTTESGIFLCVNMFAEKNDRFMCLEFCNRWMDVDAALVFFLVFVSYPVKK